MPEGYYSYGPNPNLRRFVEEHATPYDPETDDYNVPPFDKPITTTKATAIYNMHTYWSKKPHDAIRQYIRHYTKPGDIVLDPMCGSGGTALAALMEGRAAIAIDLSPAATFITKNYCTPVDVEELQRAFEELKSKVKPEMDWLYETRCDRCDGKATTAYTVYSYVFQCPRCLEKVPLFDCVEVQSQTVAGKPKTINVCPFCYSRGHEEEISTRSLRFDPVPVLVSYLCEEGCKPQRSERRYNDLDTKKRQYFEKFDLGKIKEIEEKDIPYWYPPHSMMNMESDTAPWGDKWRAGTSNFRTVAELFTKRNLWALAAIKDKVIMIENTILRDALLFCWNAVMLNVSRMTTDRDRLGYLKGTYYIPQIHRCTNVWGTVANKFKMTISGWEDISKLQSQILLVSTETATNISQIPDNSLDYIFTDPPYAGSEQYGELNFVWEAWLGFNTRWQDLEIIVNETRGKDEIEWADLMQKALEECFRILKPGRWISLCYHDTSEGTWQLLQDLVAETGFIADKIVSALYIDTGQKSYNQKTAEKVTKRDLVINFRKPREGELSAQLPKFGEVDFTTFAQAALLVLTESLTEHPGAPADRLYDELVSRLVRKGQFERHNFDELLRSVAEPVSEPRMRNLFEKEQPNLFGTHEVVRWYLKATADMIMDEAESAKEETAARRMEEYMWLVLQGGQDKGWKFPATFPMTLAASPEDGVHYSDLFEQYLLVKDKPRRLLQDWLPEFFFKTEEGAWRPPANEEERAQKEALRASGALRRIKRFANALLEGVPPHERDIPDNEATAADWIRQCRRAGLYEQGRALYEKGGFSFDELGEEAKMEVEEDYQICVRRSEKGEKRKGGKRREVQFFEEDL
jgi:hypothetical protein